MKNLKIYNSDKFYQNLNKMKVIGKENIHDHSLYVCNHNRMKDIFYLNDIIPDLVFIASSNCLYDFESERSHLLHQYLECLPLEIYGGKEYVDFFIEKVSSVLKKKNLCIFPEGAYEYDSCVHKGRTGGARILLSACEQNIPVKLIPVSIQSRVSDEEINTIYFQDEDYQIHILEEVPYKKIMGKNSFLNSNELYHYLTDYCMKKIASDIPKEYVDCYIPYSPKEKAYLCDGRFVDVSELGKAENIKLYKKDLEKRIAML